MNLRKSAGVQKMLKEFNFNSNKLLRLVKLQIYRLEPLSLKLLPMKVIKNLPKMEHLMMMVLWIKLRLILKQRYKSFLGLVEFLNGLMDGTFYNLILLI